MGINMDKMTDEEILEVMNRIQKVIMANHDKTRDEIVEILTNEITAMVDEVGKEKARELFACPPLSISFTLSSEDIEKLNELMTDTMVSNKFKDHKKVIIVGGRGTGKALSSLAYDEIIRNHFATVDESWMAQQDVLTNKQRMLAGRPDLLKEGWRQKGNRRK